MMGERLVAQDSMFYEFRLEEHVPANHLVRSIDRFVDLTGLERLEAFGRLTRTWECRPVVVEAMLCPYVFIVSGRGA